MRIYASALLVGIGLLLAACNTERESIGTEPTLDTHEAPTTPDELIERMVAAIANTGEILHVTTQATVPDDSGGEQIYGTYEGWFDFTDLKARLSYEKAPENTTDTPEWTEHWFDGNELYRQLPDDRTPRQGEIGGHWISCTGLRPLVAEILVCGLASQPRNYELAGPVKVVEGEWHGINAVGIGYAWEFTVSRGGEPGAEPTDTPGAGTPTLPADEGSDTWRSESVFFVDTSTYFPLGVETTHYRNGEVVSVTELDYETELIDRDDFDSDLLDPRASGFRTEDEAEMELLDNPEGDGPVYWLGREFEGGDEVGELRLAEVEQRYARERPTLITLYYEGVGKEGRVVLEMWEQRGWEEFLASLQDADNDSGRWPFGEACREIEAFTAGEWSGTILAGYNYERADTPATATATPLSSCPVGPHDEFMAMVPVGDGYVVTLNASIGIFELGEGYEPFDGPEALKAIAGGLRLRIRGE